MTVKDHYQDVIDQIITGCGLEPLKSPPTALISNTAGFNEVLLHTDWFVHRGDSQPHYRYRRYRELLGHITELSGVQRVANVDIGSGAGVFSWVFVDWAADNNLQFDDVHLFGYDHSTAMRNLAQLVRSGLTQYIDDYPPLHYSCDLTEFLSQLTENHVPGTSYVITLGHVLAQTHHHTPGDIENYGNIIIRLCELIDDGSRCALVAADARGASTFFTEGWNLLLNKLILAGIQSDQEVVWNTSINDDSRAKRATLARR